MRPEHLVDDYALSRNIARFGLKVTTLNQLWAKAGLQQAEFFFHQYLMPTHDYPGKDEQGKEVMLPGKVTLMKQTLERWNL